MTVDDRETGQAMATDDPATAPVWLPWLRRWLGPHRLVAAAIFLALVALFALTDLVSTDIVASVGMVLLVGVLAHQFTIRALSADDAWVSDRTRRVAARSYERGNIDGVMADHGRQPIWRRRRPERTSNPPPRIAKKS